MTGALTWAVQASTSRAALRRPLARVCLGYLVLLALGSLLAPWLAPYRPAALDLAHVLSGPTGAHPLGTDALGRDVLSRLLYGGRLSLADAAIAVLTVLVVGVGSGVTAGFLGGWFDRVFCWVVDVMLAVPVLVTLLVVLAAVGDQQALVMVVLGLLVCPGIARVVRGAALTQRQELYVAAARVSGLRRRQILLHHVLPRLAGPVIVQTSLFAGGALMIDAGLSYLGFGARPPTPTWGNMIADAAAVTARQPWLLVPPGVVLGLAVLAFGLLGDAVRDATATRAAAPPTRPTRPQGNCPQPAGAPPDPTSALLSVRGVTIELPGPGGGSTVVEDLSLDIAAGETVGLVGESGCGKSMTGRALLGLLPCGATPACGSIVFDGTELVAAPDRLLRDLRGSRIALVSQSPTTALDPTATVGRQVQELVLRHHGGSRKAARVRAVDLLREVRLPQPESVAARYPHELSGGMAQRAALALALAGDPDLLIADEPTTALDATVRTEVLELLRQLQHARGMAILLISHDLAVIERMCRRAYVMYAGQIVETAAVDELVARPRHPYTAGLLACAPRHAEPRRPLPVIAGTVPAPGARPNGCGFAPRCELAVPDCTVSPVPLLEPSERRRSRCLRHADLPGAGTNEGDEHVRTSA